MKRIKFILITILILCGLLTGFTFSFTEGIPNLDSMNVSDVLHSLGDSRLNHYMGEVDSQQVQQGRELVFNGHTTDSSGKTTSYISKYFVCTDCHNTVREDPVITEFDPEKRLEYCDKNNIPFLQGSTFWGIVNRESWYNDDYVKKYGALVYPANKSLRKAIQLCAVECSQGRPLESFEEDAILAYYWSLQLKINDLDLSDSEKKNLSGALQSDKKDQSLVSLLKSKYPLKSPATFVYPPHDKKAGYGMEGDPDKGKLIYEISCRSCHKEGGVSKFLLDYAPYTFRYLRRHLYKDSKYSLYEIIRKGTYATPGSRPYMPHYPKEKMSDQQIEDLVSFVKSM